MRVFIYEHLTAQGTGREAGTPAHGMYREGRAMRDAAVADFGRIADVFTFTDSDVPVDSYTFSDAANAADWTLLIAPEEDDTLINLAEEVWPTSGRLLGPSARAIRITSDKFALADHWYENDVPTPRTWEHDPSPREPFPVVWKPRAGAGSQATFRLMSASDITRVRAKIDLENSARAMILQEFVPGHAASVAFLCGPAGCVPLAPTFQKLSSDGRFTYLGGELPIPPDVAARAVLLGKRAVSCISGLLGYVGVDLVLGDAEDGSRDQAIEINPRLTTSYLGLRALAKFNIADAMLQAAVGELRLPLEWEAGPIRFNSEGVISGK